MDLAIRTATRADISAIVALLAVGEIAGEIVATLQLTYIPGLSRGGAWRAQLEGVRVASTSTSDSALSPPTPGSNSI